MIKIKNISYLILLIIALSMQTSFAKEQQTVAQPVDVKPISVKFPTYKNKKIAEYLAKGELDINVITDHLFPVLSPDEINDCLYDIVKYIRFVMKNSINKIDEAYINNVISVYTKMYRWIESARVTNDGKHVFALKFGQKDSKSVKLLEHWQKMERDQGLRLFRYVFFSTVIDYAMILWHAYIALPCRDREMLRKVEDKVYSIEWTTSLVQDDKVFGGYYQEYLKLIKQVFAEWKKEFEETETNTRQKRTDSYGDLI